jgi:hypothetical protein
MPDQGVEQVIRQAIAGNGDAVARVRAQGEVTGDPKLLVIAALVAPREDAGPLVDRAAAVASYREDRQLVAIVRAHLADDRELVDALARDHLADFPASYLVAWVASGAEVGGGDE